MFTDSLVTTDGKISFGSLEKNFPEVSQEIEQINQACEQLWPEGYSLFLTGSLATVLRSGVNEEFRTHDDPSDIDLWIIVSQHPGKLDLTSIYSQKIAEGYTKLSSANICCIDTPDLRSRMSIKLMESSVALKILDLSDNELRVSRTKSLRQTKATDTFYGLREKYEIEVKETDDGKDGFIWYWSTRSSFRNDFILNDIHSCFLMGNFLTDFLNLSDQRKSFLQKIKKQCEISKQLSEKNNGDLRILSYFYARFPLSAERIFKK